jgi:hypothetical protein
MGALAALWPTWQLTQLVDLRQPVNMPHQHPTIAPTGQQQQGIRLLHFIPTLTSPRPCLGLWLAFPL